MNKILPLTYYGSLLFHPKHRNRSGFSKALLTRKSCDSNESIWLGMSRSQLKGSRACPFLVTRQPKHWFLKWRSDHTPFLIKTFQWFPNVTKIDRLFAWHMRPLWPGSKTLSCLMSHRSIPPTLPSFPLAIPQPLRSPPTFSAMLNFVQSAILLYSCSLPGL